jgi:hypothetical protein
MAWPSGSKAGTTSTDNASDSISGARADINQNITNVNSIIDIFNIPGSPTDNYYLRYDSSTGKFEMEAGTGAGINAVVDDTSPQLGGDLDVNGNSIVSASNGNITIDPNGTGIITVEGDGTTPSNFAERLARLAKGDLTIDSNQTNAWWGSQLIMKDSTDSIFSMVGRANTGAKAYNYAIIMDPNGTHTNTSAYAGDYGFYFNMDYESGGGGTDWYMLHNVFGADDGYYINSYGSNHNSYARTPIILSGSKVELVGYNGSTAGGAFQVEHDHVDLNGLYLKDTSGSVTVNDNMTVNLDSGGTTALVTENESATANGNRITVGTNTTAHTSGVGFEVRRGTGSGYDIQFKVETDSSSTKTTAQGLQLTGATVDSTTSGFTQTNRLTININGTDYYIALDAV